MNPQNKNVSRRNCIKQIVATSLIGAAGINTSLASNDNKYPTYKDTLSLPTKGKKIPVIFDTDMGGDIDDTWALATLLGCPEFDVKMVLTDAGNAIYRGRLTAKLLEVANRTDIPVGLGIRPGDRKGHQSKWVGDYQLEDYKGTVHKDGVDAMIKMIHDSKEPVTLICVGAVPNIAEALKRDPTITKNARFVGMHGSIKRGYGNNTTPVAESNVRTDPKALQKVFAAPWECTVTPLDTCGIIHLDGEKYQKIFQSKNPMMKALIENYRIWIPEPSWLKVRPDHRKESTTLFDCVAIYLALKEDLCNMEDVPLRVTDKGMTVVDKSMKSIRCAMSWKDLNAFEDFMIERLLNVK